VWGAFDVVLDPSTGASIVENRSAELALRHYKVSYFLNEPFCTGCISILEYNVDHDHGIGQVIISLRNPTKLWGFDVRGIIRIGTGQILKLLNADGYTTLFAAPAYVSPAPFKLFASDQANHGFAPGADYFEPYDIKVNPGADPTKFTFLVTASLPKPAGDVSRIYSFRQMGQFLPGGGSARVSFKVEDLQNDIGGVCLHASQLGAGDIWLLPSDGRWEADLTNLTAAPGLYDLRADAHSPNPQGAVTSHVFRAVVFGDYSAFRSQLLSLVNSDRSSNGLPAVELDPLMTTVAESHGLDMAEHMYFSHTDLDGYSPADRMQYYGADFGTAGENIAVGQDSPTQVETDWMNSPGHRANLLNPAFKKIGLGIVPTAKDDPYAPGYYWVQEFSD
jgi:uncharacterized protein YkwD